MVMRYIISILILLFGHWALALLVFILWPAKKDDIVKPVVPLTEEQFNATIKRAYELQAERQAREHVRKHLEHA